MGDINNYMLNVDFDTHGIPPEAFVAIPESVTNLTMRNEVMKMWKVGHDYLYGNLALAKHPQAEAIFRPSRIEIDLESKDITLHSPSNLKVHCSVVDFHDKDVEDIVNIFSDLICCELQNRNGRVEMLSYHTIRSNADEEVASELLEKYHPLEILVRGLGYNFDERLLVSLLPRFMGWIGGPNNTPIHVLQLEPPNTGKTVFALRSEIAFNYEYLNEPPTLAHLVYDGQQKSLGPVFSKNGIIFDEFDKYSLQKERIQMVLDVLLTGMENGRWVRGVSSAGSPIPNIRRLLPILFMGNITNAGYMLAMGISPEKMRTQMELFLNDQWGFSTSALIDRIAVIEANHEQTYISSFVNKKYITDSVLRGVVAQVKRKLTPRNVSTLLSGRLQTHCNNVAACLDALQVNLSDQVIEELVEGTYPFTATKIRSNLPKDLLAKTFKKGDE